MPQGPFGAQTKSATNGGTNGSGEGGGRSSSKTAPGRLQGPDEDNEDNALFQVNFRGMMRMANDDVDDDDACYCF